MFNTNVKKKPTHYYYLVNVVTGVAIFFNILFHSGPNKTSAHFAAATIYDKILIIILLTFFVENFSKSKNPHKKGLTIHSYTTTERGILSNHIIRFTEDLTIILQTIQFFRTAKYMEYGPSY